MEFFTEINPVLYTLPFVSALIGWATNFVAIKMLFRPYKPVKILWITFQGLIPKRHVVLAEAIAEAVERDFLTVQDLKEIVKKVDLGELLGTVIREKWDEKSESILASFPMLQMFVPPEKIIEIRDKIVDAFSEGMDSDSDHLAEKVAQKADISGMIHRNILAFDYTQLEEVVENLASNEFRYIEKLGGILGFLIGLFQMILIVATS